jgi:hypothetical protein
MGGNPWVKGELLVQPAAYKIEFEQREDYLFAHISGIRTRQIVARATMEILDKAVDLGFSKVLVDVSDLEGTLSALDSYLLVTEVFKSIRWKGMTRAAVYDLNAPHIRGMFSEIVARNRGYNYRIFDDLKRAQQWLLAK